MNKFIQPRMASTFFVACVWAVITFFMAKCLLSVVLYQRGGEVTFHMSSHGEMFGYDPIDREERHYVLGKLALHQVIYKDGSVKVLAVDRVLEQIEMWSNVLASVVGLLGGMGSWYALRRIQKRTDAAHEKYLIPQGSQLVAGGQSPPENGK